jgi:hypothetical protein
MKKVEAPHNLSELAQANNLHWKQTPDKGLLEYHSAKFLKIWILSLIGWSLVALFPMLTGNPGLTRLNCERVSENTGFCRYEKIYLHPFLIPLSHNETLPLADILGATVYEIEGDESDSYQFILNTRHQNIHLFTSLFESTAENQAEDLQEFLKQPEEDTVKLKYFDQLFFWMMYAPLYLMLLWVLIAGFRKISGFPINCYWTILDNHTRQLITIHTNSLGLVKTTKYPLNSIQKLSMEESKTEQGEHFQYSAQLKSGKKVTLTPQMPVKAGQNFEAMQNELLQALQTTLTEFQNTPEP